MPVRSVSTNLNLASLAVPAPEDYILGANDTLEVSIAGLSDAGPNEQVRPINVRIMANGKVRLPLVGEVAVGNLNLSEAQHAIDEAYVPTVLKSPKTSVRLVEMATLNIPIIGEVTKPGVQTLPRYQNDIANALALAGGLTQFSADVVEVHRRMPESEVIRRLSTTSTEGDGPQTIVVPDDDSIGDEPTTLSYYSSIVRRAVDPNSYEASGQSETNNFEMAFGVSPTDTEKNVVLRIPLRGGAPAIIFDDQIIPQEHLSIEDVTLKQGDVISVPRQSNEVFFVVGPLSKNNVVNFRVSELDRQLGNAFLLPKDRDIDAVTAVAMAGYIDPIDSPTTVTVHRSIPGAPPMLIRVDLIAARSNWKENVYIQPGDIVYLNPDGAWWRRRMFDRIAPELLLAPYREAMFRWINPRAFIN